VKFLNLLRSTVKALGIAGVLWIAIGCGVPVQGVDNESTTRLVALQDQESISLTKLFDSCESVAFIGALVSDEAFEAALGGRPGTSMARREDVTAVVVFTGAENSPTALLVPRVPVDLHPLNGRRVDCARLDLQRQGLEAVLVPSS